LRGGGRRLLLLLGRLLLPLLLGGRLLLLRGLLLALLRRLLPLLWLWRRCRLFWRGVAGPALVERRTCGLCHRRRNANDRETGGEREETGVRETAHECPSGKPLDGCRED
jgi:hypothetical protein